MFHEAASTYSESPRYSDNVQLNGAVLDALRGTLHAMLSEQIVQTGAIGGSLEAFNLQVTKNMEDGRGSRRVGDGAFTSMHTMPEPNRTLAWRISSGTAGLSRFAEGKRDPFVEEEHRTIPIELRGRESGLLWLRYPHGVRCLDSATERENLGRELGWRLTRAEVKTWARHKLNLQLALVGGSSATLDFEGEVLKVAAVSYPLVLEAEFGSSNAEIAGILHCHSQRREQPFVVLPCSCSNVAEFCPHLEKAWSRVGAGTLLLEDVDLLVPEAQRHLLWKLHLIRHTAHPARIVVSTSSRLSELARTGTFCPMLAAELEILCVRVPALRERREDIPLLLEHYLEKHRRGERGVLSPGALEACQNYDWPGNEMELERLAIRLAVMAEGRSFGLADLQRLVSWQPAVAAEEPLPPCPEVLPSATAEPTHPEPGDLAGAAQLDPAADGRAAEECSPSEQQRLEGLARQMVENDLDGIEGFSVGVQRAIRYLSRHYLEEVLLGQLARESYVSVSHLSFLLKRDLGVSFKTLLAAVRIEKARRLLLENRCQSITEISMDAGFGDLSHFERTFKRFLGTSPRHFRRQAVEPLVPPGRPA